MIAGDALGVLQSVGIMGISGRMETNVNDKYEKQMKKLVKIILKLVPTCKVT